MFIDKYESLKKVFLIFIVVFLICVYVSSVIMPIELVLKYITYISLISVLFFAYLYGRIAGGAAGLIIGLINTFILLNVSFKSNSHILPLTLSSSIFLELFKGVNVFKWLGMPIMGFFVGWYVDNNKRLKNTFTNQVNILEKNNEIMTNHLNEYEKRFLSLSEKKVYLRAWDTIVSNNQESERIIGLMISHVFETLQGEHINSKKMHIGIPSITMYNHANINESAATRENGENTAMDFSNKLALKCFDYFMEVNPEILVVMNTNGKITFFNETLMAMYGYTSEDEIINANILDFILPVDVSKASENINRALSSTVNTSEKYQIKTKEGRICGQLISPTISLKCTGSPISLIASAESGTVIFTKKGFSENENNLGAIVPLMKKSVWCINPEGAIVYTNLQAAEILGYTVDQMKGKSIYQFIDRNDLLAYKEFISLCKTGNRRTLDIGLFTRSGTKITVNLDTFPSIGLNGDYFGITVFIENITDRKLIEEALKHRLSMEKMITDISTQFIDIEINELDEEITRILKMIGDFEGADRSFIKIYASDRTGEQKQYDVVNIVQLSSTEEDKVAYTGSNLVNELDTVRISIGIEGETVGFFRFNQKRFSKAWPEEDLNLIKLVGEIIVNTLARRYDEVKLKVSEERLRTTLHSIGDAVIATDTEGRTIMLNKMAEELTGWNWEEAYHKPLTNIFNIIDGTFTPGSSNMDIYQSPLLSEEDNNIVIRSRDGIEMFISGNKTVIEDKEGKIFGEVIVFRDITEKKRKDDEIRYMSFHDKLTGLYNRAFFEEELLRLDTKRQYPITLILGDANGLKIANDIFGHLEGDKLLQKIASIIKIASRKEDIVARWGGDEFAIILPKTDDKTGATIRERILEACLVADKSPIQPSIALGSATKVDDSQDIISVLKVAEDRMYRHKLLEGKSARNSILSSLEKMIFEKSYETEEHAKRMLDISAKVGNAIGLSDDELDELRLLSVLHDMGKIGIPDSVLMKPGELNEEEWEQMKKHPEKGYNIAKSTQELTNIAEFILHHHEHWDGTGYPTGLKGKEIPKLSRLLSIVDAYDVITHTRVYKNALSHDEAIAEIKRCAGTHFDPDFAEVFVSVMGKKGSIVNP